MAFTNSFQNNPHMFNTDEREASFIEFPEFELGS